MQPPHRIVELGLDGQHRRALVSPRHRSPATYHSRHSRGTGLGLPVSQKILREHGGDLTVQSQANVGSKFTLKLPIKSPLVPELSGTTQGMVALPEEGEATGQS